jgi:hypothetical protein
MHHGAELLFTLLPWFLTSLIVFALYDDLDVPPLRHLRGSAQRPKHQIGDSLTW